MEKFRTTIRACTYEELSTRLADNRKRGFRVVKLGEYQAASTIDSPVKFQRYGSRDAAEYFARGVDIKRWYAILERPANKGENLNENFN